MSQKTIVAVGAVIAVAVAAWWWFHRGATDHAAGKSSAQAAHDPQARARGDRRSDDTAPVPPLVDDDPRGNLRLEGQVVDHENKPVAGATVVLGSNPPRTATTEADGAFVFDALVGRSYTLVARAAQGVAGPVNARLTSHSDPVVLHLHAAAKVIVTVVGLGGKPADGAIVELRGADAQRDTTKAGTVTFAAVVPGGYQVAAWTDGTAKALQFVQVGAGETQVKLVLVAGALVTGHVLDEHGKGVAGARVSYTGGAGWGGGGDRRRDAVASGADGAFRFDALPAGSFRFVATHPELAAGTSAMVTIDGKTERGGVTITLEEGAVVHGRVVDQGKQPVAGARVRIGGAGGGRGAGGRGGFQAPREGYSDDKGSFELRGLPREQLQAVAIHESGASQAVAVDATHGDASIELVLDLTATISGVVVDSQGAPLEGIQVSAGPNIGGGSGGGGPDFAQFAQFRLRGLPEDLTDGSGHFNLVGLSPGDYTVSASRQRAIGRGRRGAEGTPAHTGQTDLRIVMQPEGGVKGIVAFGDGTAPAAFTIQLGQTQQSFLSGGAFEVDAIAPGPYTLEVRGVAFTPKSIDVVIEPSKVSDVGTILVAQGRVLAGIVVSGGNPVANANVYAGRTVMGTGTANGAQFGQFGQSTKTATTDTDGSFSLAGFTEGDLTIVAEQDQIGESKAVRLTTDMPGQGELVLELLAFGSLSGSLSQNGQPAGGIMVACQSTTAPGAISNAMSGADGRFRFDRLAPDTYKVSATVGSPRRGMQFFSKQVDVPLGAEVTVDLTVDQGSVELDVSATPKTGTLGVASAWLATGVISATTASALSLQMAAQGAGSSQWVIIRRGAPAEFKDLQPGPYSACVVALPSQLAGGQALGYLARHGDKLPAVCQPVTVAPSPPQQQVAVPIDIPPLIPDGSGSGSG